MGAQPKLGHDWVMDEFSHSQDQRRWWWCRKCGQYLHTKAGDKPNPDGKKRIVKQTSEYWFTCEEWIVAKIHNK